MEKPTSNTIFNSEMLKPSCQVKSHTRMLIPTMSIHLGTLKEKKLWHPKYISWSPGLLWTKVTWESTSGETGWAAYVPLMARNKSTWAFSPSLYLEGRIILRPRIRTLGPGRQTTLVSPSLIHWLKPISWLYIYTNPKFCCRSDTRAT